MKIVFLSDDFPPTSFGGAGISTFELARAMKELGHTVSAITTCRKRGDSGQIEYEGVTVYKIQSDYDIKWRAYRSLYNPGVLKEVKNILRTLAPDIVHVNNVHYHLSFHSFVLARKYARAVVFTARDTLSVSYGKLNTPRYLEHFESRLTLRDHLRYAGKRFNPLYLYATKRYLAAADKRYAVSESLKQALVQNGICDVGVVRTGVDITAWETPVDPSQIEYFRKTRALTNKKILFFNGRLSGGKGGQKILEVFKEVLHAVPDAVLLVAGVIDTKEDIITKTARTLGVAQAMVMTGWLPRDEMRIAYAVSDVVVVPSLYLDPFPRSVIEGMAAGKPVVGSCYGGSPEIIEDGITGYVVNPFDSDELGVKIIDLLRDPQKAEQLGSAGRRRIKEHFNLEDVVKEYIVGYELALQKGAEKKC